MAHDIDYLIHGNEMQFVEIELDPECYSQSKMSGGRRC